MLKAKVVIANTVDETDFYDADSVTVEVENGDRFRLTAELGGLSIMKIAAVGVEPLSIKPCYGNIVILK